MKRIKKIVSFVCGFLLCISGICIFFYPDYREWETSRVIEQIKEGMTGDTEKEPVQKKTEDETDEESELLSAEVYEKMVQYNRRLALEGQNFIDAWSFTQAPIEVQGFSCFSDPVGTIEIPDIDLTLPLYLGAASENMSKGAVVLAETSMPVGGINTNCVICAHRGWSGNAYFRDIDQLKVDSLVILHNPWDELVYRVTGTEIIHATENEILEIQPGKDLVTLFSCYPYMQVGTKYRQVIFCERTEKNRLKRSDGANIADLAREDMERKGIVIRDELPERTAEMEDQARIILPVLLLMISFMMILKKKKGKYSL